MSSSDEVKCFSIGIFSARLSKYVLIKVLYKIPACFETIE